MLKLVKARVGILTVDFGNRCEFQMYGKCGDSCVCIDRKCWLRPLDLSSDYQARVPLRQGKAFKGAYEGKILLLQAASKCF